MQIIREIKKVSGKKITIDLPDNFSAEEVEIIIIPCKKVLHVHDENAWKKDFLSISQWQIEEDDIKIKSWPIEEF